MSFAVGSSSKYGKSGFLGGVSAFALTFTGAGLGISLIAASPALAVCSVAGSTLTCTGADADGGAINSAAGTVTVNIDDGAAVTNTGNTGNSTIDVGASAAGVIFDFNMPAVGSSILAVSNEIAVEVDITSNSGTSSSTFDVNGNVQSVDNDAFNVEIENGEITFKVLSQGQVRADNEAIEILSGSSNASRSLTANFEIADGGQARSSDGSAILVTAFSAGLPIVSPTAGNASGFVDLKNDGLMEAGENGLFVRVSPQTPTLPRVSQRLMSRSRTTKQAR